MLFQYLNPKKIGLCMGLNPGHLTLKGKIESTAPLKYNKMFFACRAVNSMIGAWVEVKLV